MKDYSSEEETIMLDLEQVQSKEAPKTIGITRMKLVKMKFTHQYLNQTLNSMKVTMKKNKTNYHQSRHKSYPFYL